MANTGYAHSNIGDFRQDYHRLNDLRYVVNAIKQGDQAGAIMALQRALGSDTKAAEAVENEWRRK